MPKMRLGTTAERFMQNRVAISDWLLKQKTSVETHFRANDQRVWLLFDNSDDAEAFVESFEDL